jgi:hypothetical protein
MSKTPKFLKPPTASKTVKIHAGSINYNAEIISWQLHRIDFETKWGINSFRRAVKFRLSDDFIENLESDTTNHLLDAFSKIDGKNFDDICDLLNQVSIYSKGSLNANQILTILKCLEENIFWKEVFPKLKDFESMSWNELEKQTHGKEGKSKHHSVSIYDLDPEAQKRLEILQLDDIDKLFSLRLTGKIRIWGIRVRSFLKILWFDFDHSVYPVGYN